jgi:hypothetical protein
MEVHCDLAKFDTVVQDYAYSRQTADMDLTVWPTSEVWQQASHCFRFDLAEQLLKSVVIMFFKFIIQF